MTNIHHTILALDTSIGITTVAVWKDGKTLAYSREDDPHAQAKRLVPMVEATLAEARLQYSQLDAIASTVGPGNFTGLRVGFSTARAMALAAGKPFIGLTNFEVMAFAYATTHPEENGHVVCAVNAGRGQVYAQAFQCAHSKALPTSEPQMLNYDAVAAILPDAKSAILGNAKNELIHYIKNTDYHADIYYSDSTHIASLAAQTPARRDVPLYLRSPDAKLPNKQ